jgi:hypothetical protein
MPEAAVEEGRNTTACKHEVRPDLDLTDNHGIVAPVTQASRMERRRDLAFGASVASPVGLHYLASGW